MQNFRPIVKGRCIRADLVAMLRQRARQQQTTVTGALCAALAIAGRQIANGWRDIPLRFGCPVSTRTMLGADGCGVYFIGAKCTVEPKENAFWEIARLAKRDVQVVKTPESLTALCRV
jgi:hypothetical protein